jgi:hypothetical protein
VTSCPEIPAFAGMTEVPMKPPSLIALVAMLIVVLYLIYYLH